MSQTGYVNVIVNNNIDLPFDTSFTTMRMFVPITMGLLLIATTIADAQRPQRGQRGQRGNQARGDQQMPENGQRSRRGAGQSGAIGDSNPLPIGDSGVAWYTTWDSALSEAKRSNRPIFFMSAATTCSGVPGVF